MQLFIDNKDIFPIYNRAISLNIGKEFTLIQNGKINNAPQQGSEQTNRRRQLLAVEEQAQKNKIIEEHGQNHFKAQVMEAFYAEVIQQVNSEFDNKERLYNKTLAIDPAAPDILEILSLKAASVNRITPLAKSLPWLSADLVNLVNKPQYRKRADVQVSEPSLALRYIGLDNLKLIMPTFILKHWLPISTAPFSLLKRRLWNDSLSIALTSQFLAKEQGLDEFSAFAGAMLSNIGVLAVTRCFLNTYNSMYNKKLKAAYEQRDKKLHDTLVEFDSCPQILLDQLALRSSMVAADMIELMRFDRLNITEAIYDVAHLTDIEKMCPLAKIIVKAKAFVTFRNLAKEDLIDKDEVKSLLSFVQLSTDEVGILSKKDIDHLKLNFK